MLTRRVLSMVVAGVAVAGCATEADGPVTTELPAGDALLMINPGCAEAARRLGRDLGSYEVRAPIERLGELSLDGHNRAVVVAAEDEQSIDWSADVGVDAVVVTAGRRTRVYVYDPEAREDSGLTAPHSELGLPPPITEVAICFDHELSFSSVSAKTSLVRAQRWAMELAPERQDVTVPAGRVKAIPFRLAVTPSGTVDSGWIARGALTLSNPSPASVELVTLGDRFHELKVTMHCKVGPPFVVPALGTLACPWSVQLPDGAARTLELEAVTRGEVGGAVASVPIDFAAGEVISRDTKAWVWDEHAGFLGMIEGAQARMFELDIELGPYAWCPAEGIFMDRAMLYANDTGRRVEARTWLRVKVPCE